MGIHAWERDGGEAHEWPSGMEEDEDDVTLVDPDEWPSSTAADEDPFYTSFYECYTSYYDTFHIPYGKGFTTYKIECLCRKADHVLNTESNPLNLPPRRRFRLHRHPFFVGEMADIFKDCCCLCPEPCGEEAIKFQRDEDKRFVRGDICFILDDPGRQSVGSFHPISEGDWDGMAYKFNEEDCGQYNGRTMTRQITFEIDCKLSM